MKSLAVHLHGSIASVPWAFHPSRTLAPLYSAGIRLTLLKPSASAKKIPPPVPLPFPLPRHRPSLTTSPRPRTSAVLASTLLSRIHTRCPAAPLASTVHAAAIGCAPRRGFTSAWKASSRPPPSQPPCFGLASTRAVTRMPAIRAPSPPLPLAAGIGGSGDLRGRARPPWRLPAAD
jgi:hypothetical protein